MVFLRMWTKGGSTTFALAKTSRIKRGKDKGKVRQEVVEYIGNLSALSEWVLSKRDSVDVNELTISGVVKFGDVVALFKIADILNFFDIMFDHVGNQKDLKMILVMLINKNIDPTSKLALQEWFQDTALPALLNLPVDNVYYKSLYRAMDNLKEDEFNDILKKFAYRIEELFDISLEETLLDVTDVFTEGKKCELFLYGHNTKGLKKPKLSIGLITSKQSNIPLHLTIRDGKTDFKKLFDEIISDFKDGFDSKVNEVIVDNGFLSHENMKYMKKSDLYITSRLAHSSFVAKHVISIVGDDLSEITLYNNSKKMISRLVSWEEVAKGLTQSEFKTYNPIYENFNFVVYESSVTTEDGHAVIQKKLKKAEEKLEKLKVSCVESKRGKKEETIWKDALKFKSGLSDYININIYSETGKENGKKRFLFDYNVDWDKFNTNEVYKKYVVLLTNKSNITNKELMESYTQHYAIEDSFRTLKTEIKMEPLRHWRPERVKAEIFLCTLALILNSTLGLLARHKKIDLTQGKILKKVGRIMKVKMSNGIEKNVELGEENELLEKISL